MLTIHLETRNLGGRREQVPLAEYDPDLDDVRTLLADACALLVERDCVSLHVAGFGEPIWPVTADADLPPLLEQLPDVIWAMGRQEKFELALYSEKVQRTLCFVPEGAVVHVRCTSQTAWEPEPALTSLSQSACFGMLNDLRQAFIRAVRTALPAHAEHPWFVAWTQATTLSHATRAPAYEPSVSGFGIDLDDLNFEDSPDSHVPESIHGVPAAQPYTLKITPSGASRLALVPDAATAHTVRLSMLMAGYHGPEITIEFDAANRPVGVLVDPPDRAQG